MKTLLSGMTLFVLLLTLVLPLPAVAQGQPNYSLTPIKDGLWRGSTGVWHSLVYVADDAILLVDTLNSDYAAWLKQTLAERFPGKPVRYVIYSHSHWDHAEGGRVFADTATFIAHSTMRRNMDGRYPHMPGDMVDRNRNGRFEPEEFRIPWDEAPGVCGGFYLRRLDTNDDGHLTPAEYFADIVPPDLVYDNRMTLSFGGQQLVLLHPGRNHADDTTVVLFPEQRLLFSVDFIADALVRENLLSLPSACGPFDGHPLQEWIASYKAVEALAFDAVTTGHGTPLLFDRADVTATRVYFEYLRREVIAAIDSGLTLAQMQQTLLLEPFATWANYDLLREKNIEAAYRNLSQYGR